MRRKIGVGRQAEIGTRFTDVAAVGWMRVQPGVTRHSVR